MEHLRPFQLVFGVCTCILYLVHSGEVGFVGTLRNPRSLVYFQLRN